MTIARRSGSTLRSRWAGSVPARAAADRLAALARDSEPEVAKAAAVALLRVQVDASRMPQLIEALQGADWDLKLAAAQVLAQLGAAAQPAANALVGILRDDAADLDRTIVQTLPHARTEHWNVRESAALALGAIGPVDGVPAAAALRDTLQNREWAAREGAVRALAAFPGEENVRAIGVVLQGDDSWSCRRAAAESLTRLVGAGDALLAATVAMMAEALGDQDGGVRRLAAEFLGARGAASAPAVPALVELLASGNMKYREYAAKALRGIGPAAAAAKPALIASHEGLAGSDRYDAKSARREILETLAVVAPDARKELPELDALLTEREQPVPPAAVQRHDALVAALAALQDPSLEKRMGALSDLTELHAVEAIPDLLPLLAEDRDPKERVAAVSVLMWLDAEAVVPQLRLLLDAGPELRRAAADALAMFADAESSAKVAAVLAEQLPTASKDELWYLGLTGVAGLAPGIEHIVADPHESMLRRWGATQALALLGQQRSAKVIAAMLEGIAAEPKLGENDRQELQTIALTALARLDAKGHRELFQKYRDADESQVRQAALAGLAELGDAAARAELGDAAPVAAQPKAAPEDLRRRLENTHLRLSQVRSNTLRDVIARLSKLLDVPIVLAEGVDPKVLDGRFFWYVDFLGYHPSAAEVLGSISQYMFTGGALEPAFADGRIVLAPPAGK
ncbi:MAG TPA: HEAT repeat domain-containing protein [Planctomycetota bacterium]|nr:HEAT repeat domain-containing protein [Planctomycetota bacterium]